MWKRKWRNALRWIGANEQTIPNVKIVKIDKLND